MAGIPLTGDGLAGMSKSQLYDIMCQMKGLIDQNQQQAKQILVQNPVLARALFHAQIMLGMMRPPNAVPNIQEDVPRNPQQPIQSALPSNVQPSHSIPGHPGLQYESSSYQTHTHGRLPPQTRFPQPNTSAMGSTSNHPYSSMPSQFPMSAQQPRGHPDSQRPSILHSQPTQVHSTPANFHLQSQSHSLQSQLPSASSKTQQLSSLQPSLQPQLRHPPRPSFHQQPSQHIVPSTGYQRVDSSQMHHINPGVKSPATVGPPFTHGQQSFHNNPANQSVYQVGGSQFPTDFHHSVGNSMQVDQGSSWTPGVQEKKPGLEIHAPSSLPQQMGHGNQSSRSSAVTPQTEQLVQQIMSLGPEQISLLPPDQRQQVLQFQQMHRH